MKLLQTLSMGLLATLAFVYSAFSATVTVTNSSDSGSGSLRQAIADATEGDTIAFDLSLPATVTLSTTLTIGKSLTIKGPGKDDLTISGNNSIRVLELTGSTISLSGITVADGSLTTGIGAGLLVNTGVTATLDQCAVSNNSLTGNPASGAGIYVAETATLYIYRSTIDSNSSSPSAVTNIGGGIDNQGTLTLAGTTVSGNTAYYGPAIYNSGTGASLTLVNCTVSGNNAHDDGAIAQGTAGTMDITNCTITQNVSVQYEAGLYAASGAVTLRNTVIAGNLPANGMGERDIFLDINGLYSTNPATLTSGGYNLIGSAGSQTYAWTTGDVVGSESVPENPALGALADNGGYVRTHAPDAGSQVIDPAAGNGAPFIDGRGYLRSGTADKGGCEDSGSLPVAIAASGVGDTTMNANWNSVTGATGYLLDVATDSAFTQRVSGYDNLDVGNVTTYPVAGLTASSAYYYRIRAYNGNHYTFYSNTVTQATTAAATATFTPTATPTTTFTPTATEPATPVVTLSATGSATMTVTPTVILTATASATSTATPAQTLTPAESATLTMTMTAIYTATPTTGPAVKQKLLAYPNPAKESMTFMVSLDQQEEVDIMVYNMAGERVWKLERSLSAGSHNLSWQCSNVSPGLYLVHVKTGKELKKLKIVIAR